MANEQVCLRFFLVQIVAKTKNEKAPRLYELVTRMFLAACSDDAKGHGTSTCSCSDCVCCVLTSLLSIFASAALVVVYGAISCPPPPLGTPTCQPL
jgi:hypothetical protein